MPNKTETCYINFFANFSQTKPTPTCRALPCLRTDAILHPFLLLRPCPTTFAGTPRGARAQGMLAQLPHHVCTVPRQGCIRPPPARRTQVGRSPRPVPVAVTSPAGRRSHAMDRPRTATAGEQVPRTWKTIHPSIDIEPLQI